MPKTQPQKNLKEKIIEILREVMSASENRDWGKEAHATKSELEIVRNNNDNDFLQIADQILDEIWESLTKSLPPDAENLHTASQLGWQSQAVLKNFMDKLKE